MTHDELLAKVIGTSINVANSFPEIIEEHLSHQRKALRAVVELHKPEYWENIHDPSWNGNECSVCFTDGNWDTPSARIDYPCPTIQAIEKELVGGEKP